MTHGAKINAITSLAGANVRQANTAVVSSTSRFGLSAIGATPPASKATGDVGTEDDEKDVATAPATALATAPATATATDFALIVADTSSDISVYTYA